MGIVVSFILIICGGFACYQQIAASQPKAAELLDKLAPYKSVIGLVALIWGLFSILHALSIISVMGIWWLIYVLSAFCSVALGFLLSYPLLHQHLLQGRGNAEAKAADIQGKIIAKQTLIGYTSIGLGLLGLVLYITSF